MKLEPELRFDAVCCAMVLNCVPTPQARGEMLRKIREHLDEEGGTVLSSLSSSSSSSSLSAAAAGAAAGKRTKIPPRLFLSIPKLCLESSPAMDERRFELALRACGFTVAERNHSPKIAMFTLGVVDGEDETEQREQARDAFRKWKGGSREAKRKKRKFDADFAISL